MTRILLNGGGLRAFAGLSGLGVFVLSCFVWLATVSVAQAQTPDWLVQIDDAGFEDLPAGSTIEYVVVVQNNGFGDADPTTLEFTVPPDTTFTGFTPRPTGQQIVNCLSLPAVAGDLVSCEVPALPAVTAAGVVSSAGVTLNIETTIGGVVEMTVNVPDPNAGTAAADQDIDNNDLTEQTTVEPGADLEITLTGPASAASGSFVDFDIEVTNNGPDPAAGYDVTFTVPSGISNASIIAPPGCSISGQTGAGQDIYTCPSPAPLPNGDTAPTLTFSGQVTATNGNIAANSSVINQVTGDAVSSNNADTADVGVLGGTDVALTKERTGSGTALVGDEIEWTIDTFFNGQPPVGVVVTDTVPSNYNVTSVTANPSGLWDCSATVGNNISCERSDTSASGENVSLGQITILADVVTDGNVENVATIAIDEVNGPGDQDPSNNTDTDGGVVIEAPNVDLVALKNGPRPRQVVVGDTYDYDIGTTHQGNADFVGTITMTDTIPDGLEITTITDNGWSCIPAPTVVGPTDLTCTLEYVSGSPLQPGQATPIVEMVAEVTGLGDASNSLINTLVVSNDGPIPDLDPGNNIVSYTVGATNPGDSADLVALKSANPVPQADPADNIFAGEIQTFTLGVENLGPIASQDVVISDTFANLINGTIGATDAGFIDFTINQGNRVGGTFTCSTSPSGASGRSVGLECDIEELLVCDPANDATHVCPTIDVRVRPGGEGGVYTNTVEVFSDGTGDPDFSNRFASADYAIQPRVDVTVAKTSNPEIEVAAGQDLEFTVTASNVNNGLSSADSVEIVDTLPDDLTYISATPSSGSCSAEPAAGSVTSPTNNQVICNFGTIPNGGQETVRILVRPNNATRGTTITNNVVVSTTTDESDVEPNAASDDVDVISPNLDLRVDKTDLITGVVGGINFDDPVAFPDGGNFDPVAVSETMYYLVEVTNRGPSASENLIVTDDMPPSRIAFVNVTPSVGGSCPTIPAANSLGGTIVCEWPYLEAGETVTMLIEGIAVAKGSTQNQVVIDSDEIDPSDPGNDFDTLEPNNDTIEETTIRTLTDIEVVSKIADPAMVDVRDDFNFEVLLRVNSGPNLLEADDVVFTDNLPSNLALVGTPTAVVQSGNASENSCTGVAGDGSFTCDFGTVDNLSNILITIPVEVTSVTSRPETITNTASVTTSSKDITPSNNEASGSVTVGSSALSGTVFRDFNDDGFQDPDDTPIAGVPMTLTGMTFDNQPVSITVNTDSMGNYSFPNLAAGEYTVTRGDPSEDRLVEGMIEPNGTFDEVVGPGTAISSIDLPTATDSPNNDFALVPQASIGLAKQASTPIMAADGSFRVTYDLLVENLSLEPLIDVDVRDDLAGADPAFGNFAPLSDPANDPMALGTYTIVTAPTGTCGTVAPAFNGDTSITISRDHILPVGGTCMVSFEVRIKPAAGRQGGDFNNQAQVTGEGQLSGQTPGTNADLRDFSNDGTEPDTDNDNLGDEPIDNNSTVVTPSFNPDIALTKAADISAFSDPVAEGDTVTYNFTVRNTGDVTLTNISITDVLPGIVMVDNLIMSLDPGETSTQITATYELTQPNVDAGLVQNSAEVTGTDPFGEEVTDDSGSDFTEDEPLITTLTEEPGVRLLKVADDSALQDPPQAGDIISYSYTVINVGNVTLTDVTVTDPLTGLVLEGDPIPSLAPGDRDEDTYSATYPITLGDLENGEVINTATVEGIAPDTTVADDTSGETVGDDDPTITLLTQAPSVELVKESDNIALQDGAEVGELITYSFTVTNTGNTALYDLEIEDLLPGLVLSGGPIPVLNPNETDTDTITGEYPITAIDIENAEVLNTATVTGIFDRANSLTVSDEDDEATIAGNIEANPETYPIFTVEGGKTTSVLGSDLLFGQPATLDTVAITVISQPDGLMLDPETGLIMIAPNVPAGTYEVEYEINSIDFPALVDGTTETIVIAAAPAIEAVKTAELIDNGDGRDDVGDIVVYTIEVTNTGNVPLTDVALIDTLTDFNGDPLSLDADPAFASADLGSVEGELLIGETATYTAEYTVDLQAANALGVENTVRADGLAVHGDGVPGEPQPVFDISDDGDDTDGNTEDDPTRTPIEPSGTLGALGSLIDGLDIDKTTSQIIATRGGAVPYTITITNENLFVVGPVDLVDTLPDGFVYIPGSATLNGAAADVIIENGTVTWDDLIVPAAGEVTLTLDARALTGTPPGEYRNTANLLDDDTQLPVTRPSSADVVILPEGVFDCGDVVGKVFEDHNGNGYQDGPDSVNRAAITDQTYDGGKGGKLSPAPEDLTERGIPGVRLATTDGTVITTDENGLFNVPCAALPDSSGSNFILKVDERTLPTGYRMTTENPRVVRLTRGMVSEMNFGAAIGRVVRVDVNANAYVQGAAGVALGAPLENGLVQMMQQIAGDPVVVRLAFHVASDATAAQVTAARGLMDLTEDFMRARWRDIGRVQLRIEQTIVRAGQ